jgi:hypothetical protein
VETGCGFCSGLIQHGRTLDLASPHPRRYPQLLFIYTRAPIPDLACLFYKLASFPAITTRLPARGIVCSAARRRVCFFALRFLSRPKRGENPRFDQGPTGNRNSRTTKSLPDFLFLRLRTRRRNHLTLSTFQSNSWNPWSLEYSCTDLIPSLHTLFKTFCQMTEW